MRRPLLAFALTLALVPTALGASCTQRPSSDRAPQKPAAQSPAQGASPKLDVGSTIPISSAEPLTVSPTDPKVAFAAKKGEKVLLEGCDLKRHCRLANRGKQRGWFEVGADNVIQALKLKSSQVFDPLDGV